MNSVIHCFSKYAKLHFVFVTDYPVFPHQFILISCPSTYLLLLTCAVGLSRVRGEAHYFQVRELWCHVVFPGNDKGGRTQVCFVQHQHHVLLEISCDVIVQGWRELQDLKSDIITNSKMELWLMRQQTNIIIKMTNPELVFNSKIIAGNAKQRTWTCFILCVWQT